MKPARVRVTSQEDGVALGLRRLRDIRDFAKAIPPAAGGSSSAAQWRRDVGAVVRLCCSESGHLRDWLVDLLPVPLVVEAEDQVRRIAALAEEKRPGDGAAAVIALSRVVELLDLAAAGMDPVPWWVSVPSEAPDALTALWTRRTWEGDVAQGVAGASEDCPLTLVMVDLDHFKRVNDTHGHQVGDEVLAAVGALMRGIVGHRGRAYRWGGEELAVLLPNTAGSEGYALAWRMLRGIRGLRFSRADLRITASIGWARLPSPEAATAEALLGLADRRLYEAKHAGRDCVWERASESPPQAAQRGTTPLEPRRASSSSADPYAERRAALQALFTKMRDPAHAGPVHARLSSPVRYPGVDRDEYKRRILGAGHPLRNSVVDFENAKVGRCTGELVAVREILNDTVVLEVPVGGRAVQIHLQFLDTPWEHADREIGLHVHGTIVVPEDRSAFLWLDTIAK